MKICIKLSFLLALCIVISCERPEKKPTKLFHNTYATKDRLLIKSELKQIEGYIDVQKKSIERTYGKLDTLYLVFRRKRIVGFVKAEGKAYQCGHETRPYEIPGRSDHTPVNRYLGTWRTLEINVQHILELPYPVTIY
jgi:hypothetical protein